MNPDGMLLVCRTCREPAGSVTDRFCEECGTELVAPHDPLTDRVEIDLGTLAGVSDRGHHHARNEDAMTLGRRPANGSAGQVAAVVCDGVSTVRRPELASGTATAVALDILLDGAGAARDRMVAAVAAAATAVTALAPRSPDAPSCTLVAATVADPDGAAPAVTVGWVGDSRAYWLDAAGGSALLTTDHSWAQDMVTAGVVDAATALRDPRAHAITRWLGPDCDAEPGVVTLEPAGPGVLLLCSDGLWNYAPAAAELAAVALPALARGGPQAAAAALTTFALDAGGRDNVTVVCIPVHTTLDGSDP